MKYLKKVSPEKKSKWYFGKISIRKFNYKNFFLNKSLSIKIYKLSPIIYNFEIFVKKNKFGSMVFMKK